MQCSKGDNCSFRHDINKRAKTTQLNPSQSSSTRQNERHASRTRSPPRDRVPVVECHDGPARITSKELAPIHSVKKGTLQNACSTCRRMDAGWAKSALMRTARLKNSLGNGPKRMVNKSAVAVLKGLSVINEQGDLFWTLAHQIHDNWVAYFRIWSRRSLHRFCGRAQAY